MLKMKGLNLLLILFVSGLLIACEQPPGEITGSTRFADGRPTSVIIKVFDASNRVVTETASTVDGVFYTGRVIPPGSYTVKCFRGEEEVGTSEVIRIEADGSIVQDIIVK